MRWRGWRGGGGGEGKGKQFVVCVAQCDRAVCGRHTVAARHVEGTRAVVRVETPKVRRGWR